MKRCPTCRARLHGGAVCHRCKTDLSTLLAVEESWRRHLEAGWRAVRDDDVETLRFHARRAFSLICTGASCRLMACAALMDHDYDLALKVWRTGRRQGA